MPRNLLSKTSFVVAAILFAYPLLFDHLYLAVFTKIEFLSGSLRSGFAFLLALLNYGVFLVAFRNRFLRAIGFILPLAVAFLFYLSPGASETPGLILLFYYIAAYLIGYVLLWAALVWRGTVVGRTLLAVAFLGSLSYSAFVSYIALPRDLYEYYYNFRNPAVLQKIKTADFTLEQRLALCAEIKDFYPAQDYNTNLSGAYQSCVAKSYSMESEERKDLSLCLKSNPNCLIDMAGRVSSTQFNNFCSSMPDWQWADQHKQDERMKHFAKNFCFLTFIKKYDREVSECEMLYDAYHRNDCYTFFAEKFSDKSLCDKIEVRQDSPSDEKKVCVLTVDNSRKKF